MTHTESFPKIAERYHCWTINLTDDSPGGRIDKMHAVMPEMMPENEILIYQYLPPRRDPHSGQPQEIKRLRIFRVPVGKDGVLPAAITKCLDEMEVPTSMKMPDKLNIPPEIDAMNHESLDSAAPQVGISFPKGADIRVKKALLARECQTGAHGKRFMDRVRDGMKRAIQPQKEPAGVS